MPARMQEPHAAKPVCEARNRQEDEGPHAFLSFEGFPNKIIIEQRSDLNAGVVPRVGLLPLVRATALYG